MLRAHYASAHGGLSANGLSDICSLFNDSIELLETMYGGRAFDSIIDSM